MAKQNMQLDPNAVPYTDDEIVGKVNAASLAINWARISKVGSSLVDLVTRSAGDLSSGNLGIARMPTGGAWALLSDLNIDDGTFVVDRANNRVAFGLPSPEGRLHLHDILGGLMFWEYDGLDGTVRTVLADGPGDVKYALGGFSAVRASDGGVEVGGKFGLEPLGATNIYNQDFGADVVELAVLADGSVTVQRTAGFETYKVALWMYWL